MINSFGIMFIFICCLWFIAKINYLFVEHRGVLKETSGVIEDVMNMEDFTLIN
jgi:hypothetical protein